MRLPRLGLPLAAVAVFVLLVGVPSAFGHSVPDFEDVPEGHVAEAAIRWAAESGVTVGVGGNRFGIGETLTRYQMVTFLCRAFNPGNCQSGLRGSDRFDDVPSDHWADYSVGWAANRGITSGVSATEFGGSQTLTREQMITFLYRAEGSPTGGSDGNDVYQDAPDRSHWASLPIGWAYDEGVTGGIAAGTFGFGTNVSREEMVLFLCRTVAPGTCQPSQQPLPSSVVPTSTVEPPTTSTQEPLTSTPTGTDYGGISNVPLEASGYIDGVPVITERRPITGTVPVDVFYCGPGGKYTSEDLTDLVGWLNDDIGARWAAESSNLLNVDFTEGFVLSPDLAWDSVVIGEADNYCLGELYQRLYQGSVPPNTSQTLILIDAVPGVFAGYAGGTFARAPTLDARGGNLNVFRDTIAHELAHTVLKVGHVFVQCGAESLMVNTKTAVAPTRTCVEGGAIGEHGAILGEYDANLPHFGDGFLLSCYFRRVAGWPVGGDSAPCMQLPPSVPEVSVFSLDDDGFTVSWRPPVFTDDVPITGYTLQLLDIDYQIYQERAVSSEERSFAWDGLTPGEYTIRFFANSKYGSGVAYEGSSLPFAPSPESVQVSEITATSFKVSWSPVSGASHYQVWNSGDDPPDVLEIDEDGGIYRSYGGIVVSDGESLVLYGREPDTTYTVKVRACGFENLFGREECSTGSEEITVTTDPPESAVVVPGPVSWVSVTDAGDDWLVLSWDPVPDATVYECGYLVGDDTWRGPITSETTCELWYVGLEASNTYTVRVLACREEPLYVCGEATTVSASTRVLAPAPASYPVAMKEVGDTWITLSWNPPAADAYYSVRVDGDGGRHWRNPRLVGEHTLRQLESNTDYVIKVRTCRGTTGTCEGWVTIPVSTLRGN